MDMWKELGLGQVNDAIPEREKHMQQIQMNTQKETFRSLREVK